MYEGGRVSERVRVGVHSGVAESPCVSPGLIYEHNLKSRTTSYTRHA